MSSVEVAKNKIVKIDVFVPQIWEGSQIFEGHL